MTKRPPKKVAILQSCYVPWKGYFDVIRSVDEFIIFDSVQYTKRDWRSRNRIKTPQGVQWLTVPILVSGKFSQPICEARVANLTWGEKHWRQLTQSYGTLAGFKALAPRFEEQIRRPRSELLSEINRGLTETVCSILGISTKISTSMEYGFEAGEKNEQLLSLCLKAEATEYISGPSAKDYLDLDVFSRQGVSVSFFDYAGYPEYPQLYPPFVHEVSVLDLLFNTGSDAHRYFLGANR